MAILGGVEEIVCTVRERVARVAIKRALLPLFVEDERKMAKAAS
jgi:hypothetical protein